MSLRDSPERHDRLMELFDEACDLDASAQAKLMCRIAEEDAELAKELSALLRYDRAPADTVEAFVIPQSLRLPGMMDGFSGVTETHPEVFDDGSPWIPGLPDVEVLGALAEGGMGRILLGHQRLLNRQVAMKVPRLEGVTGRHAAGIFEEAQVAGSLEHPNIVPVHLVTKNRDGLPVLVMKRVEGIAWRVLIDDPNHEAWGHLLRDGGGAQSVHLAILVNVCQAIHFAHGRGILHLDIKPDNVMVGQFGEVYVVDWGISQRVRTPTGDVPQDAGSARVDGPVAIGTPGSMAPEMARGLATDYDVRTDVYLLGSTLHYVLTGELRHSGRTLAAQLRNAAISAPCDHGRDVPTELAAICRRATSVDPEHRFPTAEAFRLEIARYLQNRGASRLSDAAWARLEQRQALISSGADMAQIDVLLAECQFGFQQSLLAWPTNPQANAGLQTCLAWMVEHEITRESVGRARVLLGQMVEPNPELLQKVAELEARLSVRNARAARQAELEHAQDWTLKARQRTVLFLAAISLGIVIWRWAVRDQQENPHPIPPAMLAVYTGTTCLVMAVMTAIFWRRILVNTVSRHFVLGCLCTLALQCYNRALHIVPAPTTADLMSADQVIAAGLAIAGALTLARWIWAFVPILLGGALFSRLDPPNAGNIFALGAILCAAIGVFFTKPKPRAVGQERQ